MKTEDHTRGGTVRSLESDGYTWTVYEQQLPYGQAWRTLVFMSDRVVRRVKQYPPNWFDLPDSELAQVSTNT